jgi:uncharacterized protein
MQRRFLILHGLGNHRPRDHWQWWLAEALRQQGEQVLYPQFPDADHPKLRPWLELLSAEYAQLGDGERVVVCHSLACALWFQASRHHVMSRRADRVLLVAPPGPSFLSRALTVDFYDPAWTEDELGASSLAQIRLVASDCDPFCAEAPAELVYARLYGLSAETIAGAGHFTPDDGYGPWPDVLRWCTDGTARFTSTIANPKA